MSVSEKYRSSEVTTRTSPFAKNGVSHPGMGARDVKTKRVPSHCAMTDASLDPASVERPSWMLSSRTASYLLASRVVTRSVTSSFSASTSRVSWPRSMRRANSVLPKPKGAQMNARRVQLHCAQRYSSSSRPTILTTVKHRL